MSEPKHAIVPPFVVPTSEVNVRSLHNRLTLQYDIFHIFNIISKSSFLKSKEELHCKMSGKVDEKCRNFDGNKDRIDRIYAEKKDSCVTEFSKKNATLKLLKSILSNYVKFSQSPSRQDTILKTFQYSLWMLSKFYRNSEPIQRVPHRVAESLLKLQGEINWARYLLRFFGFPAAIHHLDLDSSWSTGNNLHRLGRIMSWTMVAYYPLENMAYLLWKAPGIRWLPVVSPSPIQNQDAPTSCPSLNNGQSSAQLASKLSAWSCRFWLAWIVLDVVRGILELREVKRTSMIDVFGRTNSVENAKKSLHLKDEDEKLTVSMKSKQLRLLRNVLYVLPALNWSLPQSDTQPLLSGDLVNGLCWLESMVGLYQDIHDYQKAQI